MCGIAGILRMETRGAPVATDELDGLGAALARRGPDGAGTWLAADRAVGFAHRRLAVIEPGPGGAQPMASVCGRLRIVFNGEIYNHRALRAGLEAQGHRFRGRSDTEVLLELYRRDGPAMVERLSGMYAFALWDDERRGLLLARDPWGIKPLYYARAGGRLVFASQVSALAPLRLEGDGLDAAAAVGFLCFGAVPEPFTLHRAIRAVPAGTTLWAEPGAPPREPRRFWDPRPLLAWPIEPAPAGGLAEAIGESLDRHLESDVPVGVFLSAGIDSATLLALTAERRGRGVAALTLGFDGAADDERPLAARLAARYGADATVRAVPAAAFAAHRGDILAAMDQPSVDGVNTWLVARAAAGLGLKVALSGLGGDEMFAGYAGFRDVPRLARTLAPLARWPALGRAARRLSVPLLGPKWPGLLEYGTSLPGAWFLRRALFMPWELAGLLGPDRARDGWEALRPLDRLAEAVAGVGDPVQQVRALECQWYLRHQLLRDADWAGMAHGVEIRTPLVDARLTERIAPWLGGPAGLGKRDLAALASPPLPAEVVERPKTGFVVPLGAWTPGGTRGWALEVLDHHLARMGETGR